MTQGFGLSAGAIFAGDYRVVRPLREGGMGAVHVVEQVSTGSLRALKVMHPQLVQDERLRRRFEQEARVGARVRSDHVVQVLAAGVDEPTGMPWLVMELLEGEDLAAALARSGPMPLAGARDLFAQLCHALAAAHAVGVVHRDLKPENVFLALPRREGIRFDVKVLDFGIAKVVADAQTHATGPVGTPLYMAPEQTVPGASIAPATDVWALGLVAFRVLTGEPFWHAARSDASSALMVLREVVMDPIPAASDRARELGCQGRLPEGFDGWFARCVARDPDARWRDASDARTGLFRVLGGGPDASATGERWSGPGADPQPDHARAISPYAGTVPVSSAQGEAQPAVLARAEQQASTTGPVQVDGGGATDEAGADDGARRTWQPGRGRGAKFVATALAVAILAAGAVLLVRAARAPVVRPGPQRCPAGMVLVPGGAFESGDRHATVAAFCLDLTETTAGAYRSCVRRGRCAETGLRCGKYATYDADGREEYPIVCVDWEQASTYCESDGKRLPTEDEWEWAARGGADGRSYPWGNQEPDAQLCWSGVVKRQEPCRAGGFPAGANPQGVQDLAGNVHEWTSSTFERTGSSRVYRGGSWADETRLAVRAAERRRAAPSERGELLGFRCASAPD